MTPTGQDYIEAAERVKALIRAGKTDIANVRAYTITVAEDIALKRQDREQAAAAAAPTQTLIDSCQLCDHNGHQWRSNTGDLTTRDDPDAVNAYWCSHA